LLLYDEAIAFSMAGGWCLAVIDILLLLPIPRTKPDIDDVDRAILQLLCAGYLMPPKSTE
jgi:hypothetical protein